MNVKDAQKELEEFEKANNLKDQKQYKPWEFSRDYRGANDSWVQNYDGT